MTKFHPNRLGLIASILQSNVDKKSKPEEPAVELCNYTDVYYNDTITADLDFMKATASPDQVERLRLAEGDVIITKDSETADDIGIPAYVESTHDSLVCGYHLTILRARPEKVFPKFLYYSMLSRETSEYWEKRANGVTRVSIPQQTVSSLTIPLPDIETQRRIADFLDKEISEMDALIEEFEGLAKNLSARRARLVNRIIEKHAETQEESGDPWDRHSFKLLVGSHFAGDWGSDIGHDEVDLPCVRVADFNRATSSLAEEIPTIRSYSESTYEKKHLVRDDLLVEKSGGGEKTPVGSVVLYEGDSSALCANFIEVIRLRRGQVPRFWVHMFRANFVAGETFRFVKQTTGIQNLDIQMFLDQKFVVPPSGKQREIADELDREFERMDALIEESTRLIENLKARKTALITEVVTGRKEV